MVHKKSFRDKINLNPTIQFISNAKEETATQQEISDTSTVSKVPPKGYKLNPLYVETKSKRLQLLVQPSIFKKLKDKAKEEGRSVNDLIHSILEKTLE